MRVRFEQYLLDSDRYTLYRDSELCPVEPQVFAVLAALIRHRDRVVTKQELIDMIWNGRIMSDAAISSRIKSARQAIGDDGRQQRLIKTVHGIGFRCVGDVEEAGAALPAATIGCTHAHQQTPSLCQLRGYVIWMFAVDAGLIKGSCLPLVRISVSRPSTSMVRAGVVILDVGFRAMLATIS